jgi:RNA polymerase sigma-70 factor (ECF subfamily)
VLKADGPHIKSYLFSAVRSRFFNLYKREQLISIVSYETTDELENATTFETISDTDIDNELLVQALNKLRSQEREALFLTAVEGYTAQEIADFTHQPRGTVLSLVHRAKKKIRRFMQLNNEGILP